MDKSTATGCALWVVVLGCLLPGVFSGFACLSNPCLFGICIDDINSTFSCYCMDGYTGVLCQTNWDECWSSPCLNGGDCQDGVAAFNCTCQSGFQGDLCEINVNECESNPCRNNGTCLDGANGYSCVCPPGYSGPYCEHDISVCNATEETRCENGGLCIEGPGMKFNCICTIGWEGELCAEPVDECASSPCRNGAVCIDQHANYSCACPFGYSGRNCEMVLEMCGASDPCENGAMCLIEDSISVCYCVPDFHGDRCQFQYDECLLGPGCKNGGTCIDGVDEFICSCPPDLTGDLCECLIIDEDEMNCSYVAPSTTSPVPATTLQTTLPTHVPTSLPTEIDTTEFKVETTTPYYYSSLNETTALLSTMSSGLFSHVTDGLSPEETTFVFREDDVTLIPSSTTEDLLTAVTREVVEEELPTTVSEDEHTTDHVTTAQHPVTVQETKEYESTFFDHTESMLRTTTELFFPTDGSDYSHSTDRPTNCRKLPCLNGGMCLNTTEGLKCICKTGWEGTQCEERASVKVAAFSGMSYVTHRGGNASHTKVDITARTVGVAGLMLFSHLGPGVYLALYLEAGLLKFKFSCGLQTMLLSEVQFHVNNGYDLVATVALEFLPGSKRPRHCLATVRVNNTLAMSGEQMAVEPLSSDFATFLYLGGLPPAIDFDLPVLDGFVGCMQNLVVDEHPRNILKDAIESSDIKECLSLACLSDPCRNGATCIESDNTWSCQCPNGFLGTSCERSVCENNPCEYGGTCVGFPGSGFLCLCPLGKHGQFCEYDLDIGQPVYSSSVGGLASFSAHPLPTEIHQNMILSFKFIPHDMEQISLMAFLGQDGPHGHGSDHLAISFIKGFVVLTWNLGSGPRRIFTSRPVEDFGHRPHYVQVGRDGQKAWLSVDNLGNVTGKSPGPLSELNTRAVLFLGGHDSGNFSLLPHDLPLHTGFSGCLYDARLQTGHMVMMVQQTRSTTGRSVGQCGTSLCHEHACQNGAGCIHHGSTFTCLCADGWAGPTCGLKYNPCDSSRHNCSEGATCVPQRDGYSCDCPVGRTGQNCEIEEALSDVRLNGVRSYLALAKEGLHQHRSCLDIEVMPTANHGLLLYSGRSDNHQFFSLSLQGGVLELRVSPGKHRRRGDVMVVRSRRLMALGRWHRVRAARYGRRLFLWVEGTVNSATLLPGETLPAPNSLIYIGGVPDMSVLPPGTTSGPVTGFQGCVRRFASQWKWIPLNASNIVSGRNIADCDGTGCGGDVCYNGGSCALEGIHPKCTCSPEYTGSNCQTQISCLVIGCKNGGKCVDDRGSSRCSCPLGKAGAFCESDSSEGSASFNGDSYIVIDGTSDSAANNAMATVQVEFVYLNFSTAHPDGLLLWTQQPGGQEFLGVGIQDSRFKVVWAWDGESPVVTNVPGSSVADGTWHDIAVSVHAGNVTIWADHRPVLTPLTLSSRPVSTDGRIFLGGFPTAVPIRVATYGYFTSRFHGCLQKIAWNAESSVSNFSGFEGRNVNVCDPFMP